MIFLRVIGPVQWHIDPEFYRFALIPVDSIVSFGAVPQLGKVAVGITMTGEERTRLFFTSCADPTRVDIRAYTTELIKAIRTACDWSIIRGYADNSEEWDIVLEE